MNRGWFTLLFVAILGCQMLCAQVQPAVFMRRHLRQEWNKFIVLYPEGIYLISASGMGTVVCCGEWEQRDSVIYFSRYPETYSEDDVKFKFKYDADAEGRTIIETNMQALINVWANGASEKVFISGDDGKSVELPYQADSVGVVWDLGQLGQQVKRVALYDAEKARYNNVVKIDMKENDTFAYRGCIGGHINHSYTIVDDEVLVEQCNNFEYVRMDSVRTEYYMNRYFFTDELFAVIDEQRNGRSIIPHNLPVAKDVYNLCPERFELKFERNQQSMTDEELVDAVCMMLNGYNRMELELPNKSVLSNEDEYILLVNYLLCRNEDGSEGIWCRLHTQLGAYPEKLFRLTSYIELLPKEKQREAARENLCISLAGAHSIITGGFDYGQFLDLFPDMVLRYTYKPYLTIERRKVWEKP